MMSDKPKPTLRKLEDPPTRYDIDQARFYGWLDECDAMQSAFVEGLLSQMPVSEARDGQ